MSRFSRNENGLTLVEMMVAMTILTIVFLSSMFVLIQSRQMAEESRFRLIAAGVAKTVLETVKNTPLANIATIDAQAVVAATALPFGTATLTTNPSPVGTAAVATVTVRVQWRGPKNRLSRLDMSTMRSKY